MNMQNKSPCAGDAFGVPFFSDLSDATSHDGRDCALMNVIAHLSIKLDADGKISVQGGGDVASLYRQLAQAMTQDNIRGDADVSFKVTTDGE